LDNSKGIFYLGFLLSEQQRYPHFGVEQQQSNIFPAFSHCSLVDSSHCQIPANR